MPEPVRFNRSRCRRRPVEARCTDLDDNERGLLDAIFATARSAVDESAGTRSTATLSSPSLSQGLQDNAEPGAEGGLSPTWARTPSSTCNSTDVDRRCRRPDAAAATDDHARLARGVGRAAVGVAIPSVDPTRLLTAIGRAHGYPVDSHHVFLDFVSRIGAEAYARSARLVHPNSASGCSPRQRGRRTTPIPTIACSWTWPMKSTRCSSRSTRTAMAQRHAPPCRVRVSG